MDPRPALPCPPYFTAAGCFLVLVLGHRCPCSFIYPSTCRAACPCVGTLHGAGHTERHPALQELRGGTQHKFLSSSFMRPEPGVRWEAMAGAYGEQ